LVNPLRRLEHLSCFCLVPHWIWLIGFVDRLDRSGSLGGLTAFEGAALGKP